MASRQSYEAGGWADGRLGQAYDLIDAVLRENPDAVHLTPDLAKGRDLVEAADVELKSLADGSAS